MRKDSAFLVSTVSQVSQALKTDPLFTACRLSLCCEYFLPCPPVSGENTNCYSLFRVVYFQSAQCLHLVMILIRCDLFIV